MPSVLYDLDDHVATITINRPEARNAVDGSVARGIEEGIDRLESDASAWVGILTGVPPVFSAGADLKAVRAGLAAELQTERGGFAGITRRSRSKPVIAAVDGPALAGGTEMCLACDIIVASTNATFGIPEVKRSLIAGGGSLFRLPLSVPRNIAMELAMTGDPITAERAHQIGLVNVLCGPTEALPEAKALAARINANAPLAVRASRHVIMSAFSSYEEAGWTASEEGSAQVFSSRDLHEGLSAFVEKRAPRWSGE